MARSYRKTPMLAAHLVEELLSTNARYNFSTSGVPAIGNGTTAGKLRTTASATGRAAGVEVVKASADDLWDLSAEVDNAASTFRAYWLYLSSAGAASFVASADKSSAALALAALPAFDETKAIWGVYVAGSATDFNAAGGLAAQGTIYNGIPSGASLDGTTKNLYRTPARLTIVAG